MADTATRRASTRSRAGRRSPSTAGRTRPTTAESHDVTPRPAAFVGIALAAWTVALGIAILICLSLAAWVTASHHDDAIAPAIGTAISAWLLAQHAPVSVGAGSLSIVPLGLTAMLAALLVWAGRNVARLSGARGLLGAVMSAAALALPYCVIAALLTKAAEVGQARPSVLPALTGSFMLAAVCASIGALRETGQLRSLVERIPVDIRGPLRAGFAASAVVIGVAAAVFAVSFVAHAGRAVDLAGAVHAGFSGAVLLAVISLAYTPNAVIWTSAYALGPGFAVGTGTSVTLTGVDVGAVPSIPLLAPLPGGGAPPIYSWLVLIAPIAAGVVAGWLLSRRPVAVEPDGAWWARYRLIDALWGFAPGAVAGAVLGVLASLSGGSLGGGHLRVLGPSAWWTATAATLEIGVVAAAMIWLLGWRIVRRG